MIKEPPKGVRVVPVQPHSLVKGGECVAEIKDIVPIGLTLDEATEALRTDRRSVVKAMKEDGLPARRIGRGYRLSANAIDQWLATGSVAGEAEQEEE